jgi:hypothetical protein
MTNNIVLQGVQSIYSGARLPSDKKILFTLNGSILTMTLYFPDSNMQTNEGAFESWAVVIKTAFQNKITKIIIDTNIQAGRVLNTKHYNRFLWRLSNFSKMYSWVVIGNCKNDVLNFLNLEFINVKINQPNVVRPPVTNSQGERYVEYLFATQYQSVLNKLTGSDTILNQIPVGLFKGKVSRLTGLTTTGASAIDLVGLNTKRMNAIHLYELKLGDNNGLGIISEFLFYAFVMRSVFIQQNISYETPIKIKDFKIFEDMIKNRTVKEIKGYLISNISHPLITKDVIKLLNSGLSSFNINLRKIKYDYPAPNIITNVKYIP